MISDALVVGGGPAGLMAAEQLLNAGFTVNLCDAMPSVGRKFLRAGVGGMNISNACDEQQLLAQYDAAADWLAPMLAAFGPTRLREWIHALGIDTFVGSSGKVFPVGMKAAPLLRRWLARLREQGLGIHVRHRCVGRNGNGWRMQSPAGERFFQARVCVMAMGGASWPELGADGAWCDWLEADFSPLLPANMGFERCWSERFSASQSPVKAVTAWVEGAAPVAGELMLTEWGMEGTLVYRFSRALRGQLLTSGKATLYLDLFPQWTLAQVKAALSSPQWRKSPHKALQKGLRLNNAECQLIYECLPRAQWSDPDALANAVKSLAIGFSGMRSLDEAISTAGGISRAALGPGLNLISQQDVFCAGEMLDWEAPTGGYLLTGCFATGYWAGMHAAEWLKSSSTLR